MAINNGIPTSQRELLEGLRSPELQSLARAIMQILPARIELRAIPTRKPECIQFILDALSTNTDLSEVVAALSHNAKQTISAIVHDPQLELAPIRYAAIYGVAPSLPRSGSFDSEKVSILSAFISSAGTIPPALAARLRPLVPAPKQPVAAYQPDDLPVDDELCVHTTEQAACHDVLAVLSLIDQKAVKVSAATGLLTDAGAQILRSALLAGDYYAVDEQSEYDDDVQIGARGIKPFAWALLVRAAGLATINSGKLALTAAGMKARTQPPHELLRTLCGRWLKYTDFHEFSRLEEIKGQKSARHPLAKPNDARKGIANTLARLETNRWIDIDDFFTFMFAIGESFSVVRDAWALYRGSAEYGSFGYEHLTWKHTDGRFAMAFLLEYCATLGIIDVGITLPWGAREDLSTNQ